MISQWVLCNTNHPRNAHKMQDARVGYVLLHFFVCTETARPLHTSIRRSEVFASCLLLPWKLHTLLH
jgi:hypothetical protein